MLFPGFLAVMPRGKDEEGVELPALTKGETLKLNSLTKEQKFTQPSPRFTEASLVRELEELGIGRPSTYASIISTLQDRDYVTLEEKHFAPRTGPRGVDRLREHFKTLMDVGFTAHMEELLDKVAEGQQGLGGPAPQLQQRFRSHAARSRQEHGQGQNRYGDGYPLPRVRQAAGREVRKTGQFSRVPATPRAGIPRTTPATSKGRSTFRKRSSRSSKRSGPAPSAARISCSSVPAPQPVHCLLGYPDCKHAEPYSTGVPCPREGCTACLVEKSSKRGKIFYSCSNYPQCDYALWDWPIAEPARNAALRCWC